MWELNHKEGWAFKLWCWRKLLRFPWDCKEIKPAHPIGNQTWIFIRRNDAEVEAPILWPPDVKSRWFIGKDPYVRKDWRQAEKGATEEEMVGWRHQLNGREFEQTLVLMLKDREAWCAAVHGVTKFRDDWEIEQQHSPWSICNGNENKIWHLTHKNK